MTEDYIVRKGRRGDMKGLLKLVLDQGWNNVIDHLNFQFDLFPDGVYVAENSEGEIISHCASCPLDDTSGFIAYYITKKTVRGKGIGKRVFDLSYKALGDRNISLNAAWDKQDMYMSGNFKVPTFTLVTYEFSIRNVLQKIEKGSSEDTSTIIDLKDVGLDQIIDYDKSIHPMPREKVIKWVLDFVTHGRVAMQSNEIKGWGAIYKTHRGYRMMPLYSESLEVAKHLAGELLKQVAHEADKQIEVAFPEDNPESTKFYTDLGAFNGEYSKGLNKRLFTEKDIPIPAKNVFSVLNYDHVLV